MYHYPSCAHVFSSPLLRTRTLSCPDYLSCLCLFSIPTFFSILVVGIYSFPSSFPTSHLSPTPSYAPTAPNDYARDDIFLRLHNHISMPPCDHIAPLYHAGSLYVSLLLTFSTGRLKHIRVILYGTWPLLYPLTLPLLRFLFLLFPHHGTTAEATPLSKPPTPGRPYRDLLLMQPADHSTLLLLPLLLLLFHATTTASRRGRGALGPFAVSSPCGPLIPVPVSVPALVPIYTDTDRSSKPGGDGRAGTGGRGGNLVCVGDGCCWMGEWGCCLWEAYEVLGMRR